MRWHCLRESLIRKKIDTAVIAVMQLCSYAVMQLCNYAIYWGLSFPVFVTLLVMIF
jgi:hypothetical protein